MSANQSISEKASATISPSSTGNGMTYQRIVSEEDVHSALEYLRNSAHDVGNAKRELKNAENLLKHTEALLFKMSEERSVDAKKADARTQQRWLDAASDEAKWTGECAKLYALREAASAVIEGWRTESATMRQATKL